MSISQQHTLPCSNNLAIYIHWPFCKTKCPYCDFNSHVREKVAYDQWEKALLMELDTMAARLPNRLVKSIFFGGGTPSLMPAFIAASLIERVKKHWRITNTIEITLEANPTSVEADTFLQFKQAGINRVSLGVQSFRQEELAFLGRGHSAQEAKRAIKLAQQTFERYSFDLIYARPQQTQASWREELSEALDLANGHLSLYQLTIEENTAFHAFYAKGAFTLPDEELSAQLYDLTETLCAGHGLKAYEVSNYAKPGEESRHNMAYWLGDDYVGIGPGAHGRLTLNATRHATQTLKSPERWLEAVQRLGHGLEVDTPIDKQTEAEERLMMGLRLIDGIDYRSFNERNGFDLRDYLDSAKRDYLTVQGLLVNSPDRLAATYKGRLVLTSLTSSLLKNS